ncbi:hypothetical protein AVEN_182664-1, partial [Araneus ventricosus]
LIRKLLIFLSTQLDYGSLHASSARFAQLTREEEIILAKSGGNAMDSDRTTAAIVIKVVFRYSKGAMRYAMRRLSAPLCDKLLN